VTLALGGAGLALTAAIALATMVKVFGIGLLGREENPAEVTGRWPLLGLGLLVLAYAVALPWTLVALVRDNWPAVPAAVAAMVRGPILVPLTPHFAFISPPLLLLMGVLLALIPLGLLGWSQRCHGRRRVPVWGHGLRRIPADNAVTALAFSNALREFYSFVYRPSTHTEKSHTDRHYFVHEVHFNYSQAPVFGPWLFRPAVRLVQNLSDRIGLTLQNGSLNAYLAYIGILLIVILGSVFLFVIGRSNDVRNIRICYFFCPDWRLGTLWSKFAGADRVWPWFSMGDSEYQCDGLFSHGVSVF
jgi:hypothetical protein